MFGSEDKIERSAGEDESIKLRDAEGLEVQYGLPSPYFGKQHKDNPEAKTQGFRLTTLLLEITR